MGQPKFPKKKYDTPNHPWQGDRIKEENEVRKKFGLKNKREIWKAQTRLREVRGQARALISRARNPDDHQAAREAKLLLARLNREGYVGQDATLGDVLGMDQDRILNRRLQSQVYLKGMARTAKQARQFVIHGLITIGDRRVTVPSYVVRRNEEDLIGFHASAAVADPTHPVRPRAPGQDAVEAVAAAPVAAAAAVPAPVAEVVPEPVKEAPVVVEEPAPEAAPEAPEAPAAVEEAVPETPEPVKEAAEAVAETTETVAEAAPEAPAADTETTEES